MRYEEYDKISIEVPYSFKLVTPSRHKLYYFGCSHIFSPQDSQLLQLKDFWSEFVSLVESSNSIVFVEGGVPKLFDSEESAIKNGGEGALVRFLANMKGLEVRSPEPSRKEEITGFENQFTKEEVEYYYFARMVHQWGRMDPRPNFENFMNFSLQQDKEQLNWENFDFSIENMKTIHRNLFKKDFDENETEFFNSIIDPTSELTSINRFSSFKGVTRDAAIVKHIFDTASEKKNVFVIYGFTHAVMQRPALAHLLG